MKWVNYLLDVLSKSIFIIPKSTPVGKRRIGVNKQGLSPGARCPQQCWCMDELAVNIEKIELDGQNSVPRLYANKQLEVASAGSTGSPENMDML